MKTLSIAVICAALLGAALIWIPVGPALPPGLTFAQSNQNNFGGTNPTQTFSGSQPQVTLGAVGTAGQLCLAGSTSGCASFTAPAVAGTSSNPIAVSNILSAPGAFNGNCSAPSFTFTGHTTYGIGYDTNNNLFLLCANGANLAVANTTTLSFGTNIIGFGSSTTVVQDISLSRDAAGVLDIGTGAAGSTGAKLKASGYMSVGTKFTTNAGCGESAGTITGGATAGKITTAGSTSCTTIVTMGDAATAPNGWACQVTDLTTAADIFHPSAAPTSATTVTITSGTIAASDILQLGPCVGY